MAKQSKFLTEKEIQKRYDEALEKHKKFEDRNTLLEGAEKDDCIYLSGRMSAFKELLNIGANPQ